MKQAMLISSIGLMVIGIAVAQISDSTLARRMKAINDNDEYFHALQALDNTVMENAKILIHNMETKSLWLNELNRMHAQEMQKGLQTSELYIKRLEKATDLALDKIELALLDRMHQRYQKAIEQLHLLQAELLKSLPDKMAVIRPATVIYTEIKKAGEEQKEITRKLNIAEPAEPAFPAGMKSP